MTHADGGFGGESGGVGVQPYVVVSGAPGTILIYLHTLLRGHSGPQFARHSGRCFLLHLELMDLELPFVVPPCHHDWTVTCDSQLWNSEALRHLDTNLILLAVMDVICHERMAHAIPK